MDSAIDKAKCLTFLGEVGPPVINGQCQNTETNFWSLHLLQIATCHLQWTAPGRTALFQQSRWIPEDKARLVVTSTALLRANEEFSSAQKTLHIKKMFRSELLSMGHWFRVFRVLLFLLYKRCNWLMLKRCCSVFSGSRVCLFTKTKHKMYDGMIYCLWWFELWKMAPTFLCVQCFRCTSFLWDSWTV